MKVQKEILPKSEVKLTVEIDEKGLEEYKKKAVEALQNEVKVDGFRKGKIPMDVLIAKVGEQAFMSTVIDFALQETYEKAVHKEKIHPVAYPKINIVSDKPLKYEATVAVLPEVELKKGYEKIKIEKPKLEVKEEEIKDVLENLKTRSKKWKDVEREAKKGDRVEVDFDGFDTEGVPLEGTSSKNHPVVLGENTLIPGFEEEIVGMKKEEEKDFNITFPSDYHAKHFQSKKVKFKVKLNRIEEGEEHKIDDEFAAELTGGKHKDLKSLKEEIKEELTHQKEHDVTTKAENDFLEKLVDFVKVDLPEALVDREKEYLKKRIESDLEKRGINWDDYEKMMAEKKKDLNKEMAEQAKKQILIRLGLEKIYEEEKVEVSKDDIEGEIKHMLSHYPKEYEPVVREQYKEGTEGRYQLETGLKLKKLVKKFTK
ncbi:trigger factor [Patescibacteria group bacterium]|nr:trigger factor [Patescibacteria group bacterium]